MVLGAVGLAAYVHHSMGQVRQKLPLELLEQQRDMAAIGQSLGDLQGLLEPGAGAGGVDAARDALRRTGVLLRTVRRDYTFDSVTGASAAHALINPAVQDIERWLNDGLQGYQPDSPVVRRLALVRVREASAAMADLEAQTAALALSLLDAESQRLARVRVSLLALITAFAVVVVGVVILYARQRAARDRVALTEGRLSDSLESVDQAMALFGADDRLILCNRGYRDLFRVHPDADAGTLSLTGVMHAAFETRRVLGLDDATDGLDVAYVKMRARSQRRFELQWSDGRFFQVSEHVTKEQGTVCFYTDITDLKIAQRRLEYLAAHDALTGLPTRRRFHADLTATLARAQQRANQVAVVFIDVDRLKWINDTYGHIAGDRFLKELGLRLGSALGGVDRVARLSGDEFALALGDVGDLDQVVNSVRALLETLAQPVRVDDDTRISTTVSMGVAVYPGHGADASTLMKHADDACYHAKRQGRATYQVFDERISARSVRRTRIEHRLRSALDEGGLDVAFQPQLHLESGEVTGFETLLRWQHPELGTVEPAEFVPVAEDSGLGRALLDHALAEACRALRRWLDEDLSPGRVWVNVSPRQLHDVRHAFEAAAGAAGVDASMLGIEITERTFVDDPERAGALLADIRARGLTVAIDDFGVGYSSLAALKDYPLDELKIDASFVRDLAAEGHDSEIVRAIVALGRSLGLTVVAEGVETPEQRRVLHDRSVDVIQGNLLSPPLSGDAAADFLRVQTPGTRASA